MQLNDAVITKLLPEPESIIKLTVCGCKTGCNNNMRKCLKNGGLKRTEMCKCENCENVESEDLIDLHCQDLKENEEHKQ